MRQVVTGWIASAAIGVSALAGGEAPAPALEAGGFALEEAASGFDVPVDVAFAADGRMFVAEKRGIVWVVQDGQRLAEPFIDLTEEVNSQWHRGLLGVTLDPGFMQNHTVYLLYVVDPMFGEPDESPFDGTFSRLTSYVGTLASDGNVADCESRRVLIGATPSEGIPACEPSHTIGTVRFGLDGSLLVSAGDGAHFDTTDSGGLDPECFGEGMFGADEDIGAFRAQYLGSLAGKILRIDPETGLGLPSNPYWTGDGTAKQSKIWAYGLRNPFRFAIRPGTAGPGTVFIGDAGWAAFEEINVAYGGENFGWPCFEGFDPAPDYPDESPASSGCDTIESPENPGPLTDPVTVWHNDDGSRSVPPGVVGQCTVGGTFYDGHCWPAFYRGAYLYADLTGWIRVAEIDAEDRLISTAVFATGVPGPVDLEPDPHTGDLHVVSWIEGTIRRIVYSVDTCAGDITCNGSVGVEDLLEVLANWGPCGGCPPDLDRDGIVTFGDVLVLLGAWGICPR